MMRFLPLAAATALGALSIGPTWASPATPPTTATKPTTPTPPTTAGPPTPPAQPNAAYPAARKTDVSDDYHGARVPDPYRWLEDLDSPETRAWVEAENRLTFQRLGAIPGRKRILDRLTALWNYERYSVPFQEGGRYFWTRNDGLQNQNVVYTAAALDAPPRVLLDPNALSPDGTIALSGMAPSHDGKLLAYGLSSGGSDWTEWRVREVETGKDRPDLLQWVKFSSASWTKDGKGFFYSAYDEPRPGQSMVESNYYQKLYYHRLGELQSRDTLVYQRRDEKEWHFVPEVTDDGRYLVITIWKTSAPKHRIYYQDLLARRPKVVPLIDSFESEYSFLDNRGPVFWFKTDGGAPRGRIIAIDTRHPDRARWQEVVAEQKETLKGAGIVGDRFFLTYLEDAHSVVRVHGLDGRRAGEVALPGLGTASGFGGKRSDRETFYLYASFTAPPTVYRYDVAAAAGTVFREAKVDFDPARYETHQVFYPSRDGTRIPMFITHKKGLALDGRNPTYLYGYGGFNIALTPAFSPANLMWMELGGVYAVPNLRGGGEYGEAWHLAGTKQRKQNVFDDFIAAAEWLIAQRYTSREKLAIGGGSNGGLLVGACLTQRPDLFGAALPQVGVMDMLRYQKYTIGWAWADDFGTSDDPEMFPVLRAYSPLHNIRPGKPYPPTLITTGDHDDRVVPAHSYKFAAALQAAQAEGGGKAPVLIRIETRAGHGAGKPTTKIIEETADRWAFLTQALGMTL